MNKLLAVNTMNREFAIKFESNNASVIVENNEFSVWAYMVNSDGKIINDAFVCSPIIPEENLDEDYIKLGNPPKLCTEYATQSAYYPLVSEMDISVKFSDNGDCCIFLKNEPIAAIYLKESRGFSKSISKVGGFGNPWSNKLFLNTFGYYS